MTEHQMHLTTKRGVPGPHYKMVGNLADLKARDKSGAREVKACLFLEQAAYDGQKYPATKLNPKFDGVDKSPRSPRMWKESAKDQELHNRSRIKKIEKEIRRKLESDLCVQDPV